MAERKRTRKAFVDMARGTPVNIGKDFSFKIGDTIKPPIHVVRYILQKLYASAYAEEVTPEWGVPELLVSASNEELLTIVPVVAKKIDFLLMADEVRSSEIDMLASMAYTLAWWYHWNGYGPRPLIGTATEIRRKAYRRKIVPTEVQLNCPFCNKPYKPDPRWVRYSAIAVAWHKWLYRHFRDYHKWEVK